MLVRIAIAHQAHFDLTDDIARARTAGAQWSEIAEATDLSVHQARTRWDTVPTAQRRWDVSGQLAIW
ncbi:hypothetical protein [Rhodococcus jostii]|uniref:hypothetical protein n=1 Tax=Rhodococcus jostii TaxID=132919 RepID=UPI003633E60C